MPPGTPSSIEDDEFDTEVEEAEETPLSPCYGDGADLSDFCVAWLNETDPGLDIPGRGGWGSVPCQQPPQQHLALAALDRRQGPAATKASCNASKSKEVRTARPLQLAYPAGPVSNDIRPNGPGIPGRKLNVHYGDPHWRRAAGTSVTYTRRTVLSNGQPLNNLFASTYGGADNIAYPTIQASAVAWESNWGPYSKKLTSDHRGFHWWILPSNPFLTCTTAPPAGQDWYHGVYDTLLTEFTDCNLTFPGVH